LQARRHVAMINWLHCGPGITLTFGPAHRAAWHEHRYHYGGRSNLSWALNTMAL